MIFLIPQRPPTARSEAGRLGYRRWRDALGGGFTLLEVIIVIGLLAFVYAVALPQFNLKTGAEASTKLGRLASDIRSAFDLAVLSGKTYRLVWEFASGDYHLEVAERRNVYLGDADIDRDPLPQDETEAENTFEQEFAEFEQVADEAVVDSESGRKISADSPVIRAKNELKMPRWKLVETLEWRQRSLGPNLIVMDMQAEHHRAKQELEVLGEKARAFLYFFPHGYVERAVIHVGMKGSGIEVDRNQEPYTLVTDPYSGTAEVMTGYKEVDVHAYEKIN